MKWSFYKAKTFNRCQRKWYYSEIEASHSNKDTDRREIYLLKQLQSVPAWRGSVVDTVIDQKIIPGIIYDNLPTKQELIDYAFELMDAQLEFARDERHKDPEMTKTSAGEKYCALYDIEYNGGVKQEELKDAQADIESAIGNLLDSNLLQELKAEKPRMISQRPLICDFRDASIACVPDLLVFYEDKPPKIIDWKVHRHGNTIFKKQLVLYALVMTKIDPHQDFPDYVVDWLQDPTDFSLLEYQLLLDTCREYSITTDDVVEMENHIYSSLNRMQKLVRDRNHSEIDIEEFQTAISPGICDGCEFKEPCWEGTSA